MCPGSAVLRQHERLKSDILRISSVDPLIVVIAAFSAIVGAGMGTVSGLIPGIHVNTLASLMLIGYVSIEGLLTGLIPETLVAPSVCCMIMSASVVHSFLDFVPSVFIGAPDGEDAISVLPGHRLLLMGQGMRAVRAAAVGSLIGCSAAIILAIPIQYAMFSGAESFLDTMTRSVLVFVVGIILYNELRHGTFVMGILAFVLSGALGYAVMELHIPSSGLVEGTLLLPMLSGLFGLPVLLESDDGHRIPRQTDDGHDPVGIIPGMKGVVMGTVAGWFPGITSTVGATVSASIMPDRTPERFVSTVASIGTVTTILSLVTLSVSGGGRSGTVIVIGDILGDSISGFMTEPFMMLLIASGVASMLGYVLTIWSGKAMSRFTSGISQKKLNKVIIVFTLILIIVTTGYWGLLVLACALCIGFIPVSNDMGKTALCGCLILPVLLM